MTIYFNVPKLRLLVLLWGCLIWSGCSAIIPQSNYIWSENYALDTNGGDSSEIPETIPCPQADGTHTTI